MRSARFLRLARERRPGAARHGVRQIDEERAVLLFRDKSNHLFCVAFGESVAVGADVNGDGRIGLEEVIYILQKSAEFRN